MNITVNSIDEMQEIIVSEEAVLFYISTDNCGVCEVLKPKIEELFRENFNKFSLYEVNSSQAPEIAAQMSIFTVPTLLLFINGQEFLRESRSINFNQLREKVSRAYSLFFSE